MAASKDVGAIAADHICIGETMRTAIIVSATIIAVAINPVQVQETLESLKGLEIVFLGIFLATVYMTHKEGEL